MGSLTTSLPASGRVYADAPVYIYAVEKHPTYGPLLQPLWQAVTAGSVEVVSSELTLMEALVAPYRRGDANLANNYEQFFRLPGIRLAPLTADVLRSAARLRASRPNLRTPDALHLAAAQAMACALFLTNDVRLRSSPGLNVVVLDDVLAAP